MKSLLQVFAGLAVFVAASHALAAERVVLPNYHVGDTARVDIIAPFPLVAVDPVKTAELKAKEAARVPAIFRWDTNASGRVVSEFRSRITEEQVRFLDVVINEYKRATLDERAVNNPRFRRLVTSLQESSKPFPLTLPLAKTWATNGDDTVLLGDVQKRFEEAAALHIRPEAWPDDWKNTWQFKVVPTDGTIEATIALADKTRLQLRRTNFFAIGKLRSDFPKPFTRDQKPFAKFAADLLKPNCIPEERLTRELRARRVQDVWSATTFNAGETIVRSGDVITPLTKATIDELRIRMLAMKAQEPPQQPAWIVPSVTAGAVFVVICAGIVAWNIRRRRAAMLALQVTAPAGISADPAVRAQLVERLTRLLGETFVKRLFVDRTRLLESHNEASVQTQQLEERIEYIQTRVQEKYREYEERIAELERELATAEEEKRDLIRAKIVLAREELEAERAKHRVDWN